MLGDPFKHSLSLRGVCWNRFLQSGRVVLKWLHLRTGQVPMTNRRNRGQHRAMPLFLPASQREVEDRRGLLGLSACRNLSGEDEIYLGTGFALHKSVGGKRLPGVQRYESVLSQEVAELWLIRARLTGCLPVSAE